MTPIDFGLRKAAYDFPSLCEITSIGRSTIYEHMKRGDIRPTKVGVKTIFLAPDVVDFLQRLRGGGLAA